METNFDGQPVTVTAVRHNQPGNYAGQLRTVVLFTDATGVGVWPGLVNDQSMRYPVRNN